MRHRIDADTDLELIPPEPDEADAIAAPIPTERRSTPRFVWALVAAGLLVAGVIALHSHDKGKKPLAAPRPAPAVESSPSASFTVHVDTLKGHGLVAIAADGHLRVLDGDNHAVRDVTPQGAVSRPMWSPSGRWLSYVLNDKQVWVTRADESEAHQVGVVDAARPDTVAWSPKTDTLAMITSAGIELVPTTGGMFPPPLMNTAGASSLSWSADGTKIAFTMPKDAKTELVVLDESNASERVVSQLPGSNQDVRLAGWWPDGNGLLAWRVSTASVDSAFDGTDLMSVDLSGKPMRLTTMLPYPQWLSWSPDSHHVAVVAGGGHEANTNKHIAVCDVVAGRCRDIAGSPGTVAVDPAWSPDGSQIAFVQADDDVSLPFLDWLRTRELWTMRPDGSDAKRLGALDGVDWLNWSTDGKRLLAVGGENAVWLVDPTFVGPVASPLSDGGNPPVDFYSFIDWSQTLAWHESG